MIVSDWLRNRWLRKAIFVAEAGDAMVQLGFATRAELDAWRQGSSLERGDQEQVREDRELFDEVLQLGIAGFALLEPVGVGVAGDDPVVQEVAFDLGEKGTKVVHLLLG